MVTLLEVKELATGLRSVGIHSQNEYLIDGGTPNSTIYLDPHQTADEKAICFLFEALAIWNRLNGQRLPDPEEENRWNQLKRLAEQIKGNMQDFQFLDDNQTDTEGEEEP